MFFDRMLSFSRSPTSKPRTPSTSKDELSAETVPTKSAKTVLDVASNTNELSALYTLPVMSPVTLPTTLPVISPVTLPVRLPTTLPTTEPVCEPTVSPVRFPTKFVAVTEVDSTGPTILPLIASTRSVESSA